MNHVKLMKSVFSRHWLWSLLPSGMWRLVVW